MPLHTLTDEEIQEGWTPLDWYAAPPRWMERLYGPEQYRFQLNRHLTDEEHGQLQGSPLMDAALDPDSGLWDMTKVILAVRHVAPDVTVERWRHMPLPIYLKGLSLPFEIYEIENAMGVSEAIVAAKEQWKSKYSYLGIKGTLGTARLARQSEMKMSKLKQLSESAPEEGGEAVVCKNCGQKIDDGDSAWIGTNADKYPVHSPSCPPEPEEVPSLILP